MNDPLNPTPSLLAKLGSIIVHAEEMLDPQKGHPFDQAALDQLMGDKDVAEWLAAMNKMAMLPKKR